MFRRSFLNTTTTPFNNNPSFAVSLTKKVFKNVNTGDGIFDDAEEDSIFADAETESHHDVEVRDKVRVRQEDNDNNNIIAARFVTQDNDVQARPQEQVDSNSNTAVEVEFPVGCHCLVQVKSAFLKGKVREKKEHRFLVEIPKLPATLRGEHGQTQTIISCRKLHYAPRQKVWLSTHQGLLAGIIVSAEQDLNDTAFKYTVRVTRGNSHSIYTQVLQQDLKLRVQSSYKACKETMEEDHQEEPESKDSQQFTETEEYLLPDACQSGTHIESTWHHQVHMEPQTPQDTPEEVYSAFESTHECAQAVQMEPDACHSGEPDFTETDHPQVHMEQELGQGGQEQPESPYDDQMEEETPAPAEVYSSFVRTHDQFVEMEPDACYSGKTGESTETDHPQVGQELELEQPPEEMVPTSPAHPFEVEHLIPPIHHAAMDTVTEQAHDTDACTSTNADVVTTTPMPAVTISQVELPQQKNHPERTQGFNTHRGTGAPHDCNSPGHQGTSEIHRKRSSSHFQTAAQDNCNTAEQQQQPKRQRHSHSNMPVEHSDFHRFSSHPQQQGPKHHTHHAHGRDNWQPQRPWKSYGATQTQRRRPEFPQQPPMYEAAMHDRRRHSNHRQQEHGYRPFRQEEEMRMQQPLHFTERNGSQWRVEASEKHERHGRQRRFPASTDSSPRPTGDQHKQNAKHFNHRHRTAETASRKACNGARQIKNGQPNTQATMMKLSKQSDNKTLKATKKHSAAKQRQPTWRKPAGKEPKPIPKKPPTVLVPGAARNQPVKRKAPTLLIPGAARNKPSIQETKQSTGKEEKVLDQPVKVTKQQKIKAAHANTKSTRTNSNLGLGHSKVKKVLKSKASTTSVQKKTRAPSKDQSKIICRSSTGTKNSARGASMGQDTPKRNINVENIQELKTVVAKLAGSEQALRVLGLKLEHDIPKPCWTPHQRRLVAKVEHPPPIQSAFRKRLSIVVKKLAKCPNALSVLGLNQDDIPESCRP
ncbi:expressed unknown protein [Seminavis robusta]|uniref:Uncharacterized protein n=1 Tax=Seminavis robusta TaxID=568900 RepID=A0A9N8DAH7_9STRA|nr:expressed unknown protein [Seminavis robusta]|eukprot:Sro33_g021600.1 n/a (985) ;mRNA; r:117056-120010